MPEFRFASESVTEGHPDKLCDRVSDAVLDACLAQDADSRVMCDAVTKSGMVMILGEAVSKASVNYEQVIREAVKAVGCDSEEKGLDWRTMNVIVAIEDQGPDIAAALAGNRANDSVLVCMQGVVSGYATDEAADCMPLSHSLASQLCAQMDKLRKEGPLSWLRPDARVQVTVEYKDEADGAVVPVRVHCVAILYSHTQEVKADKAEKDLMEQVVKVVISERLLDSNTQYQLSARAQRSASSDAGLSGRKADADMYGGWGSGGGCTLSGRDGSTVARSAAYGARWAARSLVAARLCRRCTVQLSYTPGSAEVASILVQSYGSSRAGGRSDAELADILAQNFDLSLSGLKRDLGLKGSQFQRLSAHGHFGRAALDLPWEKPKVLK
ncbi:unnamed protein product [Polarella glacialis]|uniref:S-adenosylmethionine synthase n=1 Tax=Polarella glacialis TaxID=89957 RepID=A0A813KFX5_POLGL|nr:unnamed protein product [Polarella glacialis]CAE8698951.1 unnamed protein product [Polarella glacialis]